MSQCSGQDMECFGASSVSRASLPSRPSAAARAGRMVARSCCGTRATRPPPEDGEPGHGQPDARVEGRLVLRGPHQSAHARQAAGVHPPPIKPPDVGATAADCDRGWPEKPRERQSVARLRSEEHRLQQTRASRQAHRPARRGFQPAARRLELRKSPRARNPLPVLNAGAAGEEGTDGYGPTGPSDRSERRSPA